MMRSLSSGVAGLRTHQTRMDVIGNNIANVNTAGFKSSRVTFADVYYQNLGGATGGNSTQGGQNPTQIGYGSSVATIDVMNSVSSATQTDRPLDIYLKGEGFLACKDVSGNVSYTRLGNLGFDSHGNLVDGNGKFIMGFPMNDDGTPKIGADGKIEMTELTGIHCDPAVLEKLKDISVSPTGEITGVLDGDKVFKAVTTADFVNTDSLYIPSESNYSGDVMLYVGALPSDGIMQGQNITGTSSYKTLGGGNPLKISLGNGVALDIAKIEGSLPFPVDSTFTLQYKYDADVAGSGANPTHTLTFEVKDKNGAVTGTYEGSINFTTGEVTLANKDGISPDAMELTINPNSLVDQTTVTDDVTAGPTNVSNKMTTTTVNNLAGNTSIDVTNVEFGDVGLPEGATYKLEYDGAKTFTLKVTDPNDAKNNVTYKGTIKEDGTVVLKSTTTGNTAMTMTIDPTSLAQGTKAEFDFSDQMRTLKYQVITGDDGGNVVKLPAEPGDMPTSGYLQGLDGIELEIDGSKNVTAYVGKVGTAQNDEDIIFTIGVFAVARFQNANGLKEIGSSYFGETANSGDPAFSRPGLVGSGETVSSNLEASNVDLSSEFTNMIITQRGFQANSRIITVSDTMLEELVNLKR